MNTLFCGSQGSADGLRMSGVGNNPRVQFEENSLLEHLTFSKTKNIIVIANGISNKSEIDWSWLKCYVQVREKLGKRTNNFFSQDA